MTVVIIGVVSLVAAAAAVTSLVARGRLAALKRSLAHVTAERDEKDAALRRLEPELAALRERLAVVGDLKGQLADQFKVMVGDALSKSSTALADTTKHILEPLRQSVERVDRQAQQLEQARRQAYGALANQLKTLNDDQERLRLATTNLTNALRTPHIRGRWGEVQLKRIIEVAGMVEHCDFVTQETIWDGDGKTLRPDVIVKLPGGKSVVIDSKAPLDAYLAWIEASEESVRDAKLKDHARQVRDHVTKLAAKRYWLQVQPAPDFVIMFLPDETFLRAALEHDPSLQENAWQSGVIVASPSNLITALRTVGAIWQQEAAAENARQISTLGRELYERLGTFGKHLAKVGRSLDGAVGAYNEAVGSLESRVLVTARKFDAAGIEVEVPQVPPIERQSRPLQALELTIDTSETVLELSAPADAA